MAGDIDPLFEEWKARAREADVLEVARSVGVALKKAGKDWVSSCPVCGGKDKNEFVCTPGQPDPSKRWFCRKSSTGGDPIAMHMHVTGSDFMGACESITGSPPPRGGSGRKADPDAIRERKAEQQEEQRRRDQEAARIEKKKIMQAGDVWEIRKPIKGSLAWRYLAARKIELTEEEAIDLAFIPSLEYWGYADAKTDELSPLGSFPCMIAAVRNLGGDLIAVHRTYLDPKEPKKLRPPGDLSRNKAKKIVGKAGGGFIRLGFIGPLVAMGEGIETTLSFARIDGAPAEVSLIAGVSLGNMAGGALDTVPHPKIKGRSIPNGIPDPESPGIILPGEVEELIILGDGDSDPEFTRASLLTGARRYREAGVSVMTCFAPPGKDFNDLLIEQERGA